MLCICSLKYECRRHVSTIIILLCIFFTKNSESYNNELLYNNINLASFRTSFRKIILPQKIINYTQTFAFDAMTLSSPLRFLLHRGYSVTFRHIHKHTQTRIELRIKLGTASFRSACVNLDCRCYSMML